MLGQWAEEGRKLLRALGDYLHYLGDGGADLELGLDSFLENFIGFELALGREEESVRRIEFVAVKRKSEVLNIKIVHNGLDG